MKKTLFAALALVSMASCSNEDVLEVAQKEAIVFDNAFVENSTRAVTDLTKSNLSQFSVYGAITANNSTGLIFNNVKVYTSDYANYTYDNKQYWVANADYNFTAIAPYVENAEWKYETSDAKNGTITYNAASDIDLLFANNVNRNTTTTISTEEVAFTFNHMLSRVRMTFVNAIPATSNITLKISDVKISNAGKTGTLPISAGTSGVWTAEENQLFTFASAGDVIAGAADGVTNYETTEHHYFIPVERTYEATFKVTLIQAGVELGTYERSASLELNLQKGYSYDIKANLTAETVLPDALKPIEFTVNEFDGWETFKSTESTVKVN